MSLSISPFKAWVAALLVLLAVEGTYYWYARPNEFDRNNFLQYSFGSDETFQRAKYQLMLKEFAYSRPTIVQSGDSSGFYGIQPKTIEKYLPEGMTYLNLSCCANLGYRGYFNALKFMVDRNESVRYIVLHVTPYTMPRPETWDGDGAALWQDPSIKVFGDAFYQEFMSGWRILHLPTLAMRRAVTNFVYYRAGQPDRPLMRNKSYELFLTLYKDTKGWMPESDRRVKVPPNECDVRSPQFFDFRSWSRKTYLEEILETYAQMAKQNDVTLVVVFQPVACTLGTGKGSAEARAALERFKSNHPDVEIPFPLITTWPSELFSVPAHVKREHTDLINDRLGKALAEIINRRGL